MASELKFTLTPQELDLKEQSFLDSQDWAGWIEFSESLSNQQAGEEESRAIWRRLIKKFEGVFHDQKNAGNDEVASDLSFYIGQIWDHRLNRKEHAVQSYLQSFELNGANIYAIQAAREIYEEKKQWELALQLYTLELELVADPDQKAEIYLKMAEISNDHLNQNEDAVRCVKEAAKISKKSLGRFQNMMDEISNAKKSAFDTLMAEADSSKNPRQKAKKLYDAAEVLIDLDPEDDRIEKLLQECLEHDPRNEEAKSSLQRFYQLNERWSALSAFLAERLAGTQRRSDRLDILKKLAYINQYALQNDESSADWHKQVLELSPNEDESISFCANYFGEQQKWQELVNIYESALKMHRREGEEMDMLFQIAMILWKKISNYVEADKYFRRIKVADPKHSIMLNFYVDFYREQGDWRKLLTTLATQQSNAETDDERIKISVDMAILAENELASPEKAIETWKSILKLDPLHKQSRDALDRLYRQGKKWNALLEHLKEELDILDSDQTEEKIDILLKQIDIYQQYLNQTALAIQVYHQILEINPQSELALNALEKAYLQAEKWAEYFDILVKQADILKASGDQSQLLVRYQQMAKVARDKLKDNDIAISYFEQIIELDESDMSSLDSLAQLYLQAKSWQSLFETYQKQLAQLDPPKSTMKMVEMAHLAKDHLNDLSESIELWKVVLSQAPEREDVWHELADLYQRESNWEELSSLFAQKIESLEGNKESVSWMKRRADLFGNQLNDLDESAGLWWKVLELAPGDQDAETFLKNLFEGRKDWDSLEKVYELRNDFNGLVSHFKTLVESESDKDQRIELYRRIGITSQYKLDDEASCIEAWEKLLLEDSENLDAAETLIPFYQKQGNWEGLEQLLLIREKAELESIEILSALAELYEQHLKLNEQAYEYNSKRLRLAPSELSYLEAVIRCANATAPNQWEDCVDLLEELSKDISDDATQLAYIRHLAKIQHRHLSKWVEAADCYEKVRELAGDEAEVLDALCEIYSSSMEWKSLLSIYQAQIKFLNQQGADQNLDLKIELQAQIAQLYETQLEDLDRAQRAYEELRSLNPKNLAAIRGLQRISEQKQDDQALSRYLSDELEQTTQTDSIAQINHRLGVLAQNQGQESKAIEYYAKALAQNPLFEASADALQQFLAHSDQALSLRAAQLIEAFVRHYEQYDLLKDILNIQYEGSTELSTRKKLLLEIAQIEENKLLTKDQAFESYQKLLIDDRTDENTIAQLERLANELNRCSDLAAHYERFTFQGDLSDATDQGKASHTQAAKYGRRLANLQEQKLNDFNAARDTIELLLKHEGDSLALIDILSNLNEKLNDHEARVKTLERRINVVKSKTEKIDGLLNIALLYDDVLNSPEDAINAYHRVLSLDESNEDANQLLDKILRRIENYSDLATHLSNQKSRAQNGNQKAQLQEIGYQLARVYHLNLERQLDALEEYAQVLSISKHQPSIDAIREILNAYSDGSDEIKEIRARGCDILAPIYESAQDWLNSIHLLQIRLDDQEDQAQRTVLHIQIAQYHENQGQDAIGAYHRYSQAFKEDFGNTELLTHLQRLAQQFQLWTELASLMKQGLEEGKADDQFETKLQLLDLNAKIYENHIGDLGQAISTYEWLLSEEPNRKETLTDLSRLYVETENWEKLAEILIQEIDLYEDEESKAKFAFELGQLYEEKLSQFDRAIDIYERIRTEIQADSSKAYRSLERLYLVQSQYQQLVDIYQDEAAVLEGDEKRNILLKAADIYETRLAQPEEAVTVYQSILEISQNDEEVLNRLAQLFDILERYEDLLNILSQQKSNSQEQSQKNDLEYRRAILLKDHLGQPTDALASLKDVIATDENHQGAKEALETLLYLPEVRLEAAQILVPLYEKSSAWDKFVRVLHDTLNDREIDDQIVVLRRAAEVEEKQLLNASAAFESLSMAYKLSNADLSIEEDLERITKELFLDSAFVALLEEVVFEVSGNAEREIQIRTKIAAFAEEKLLDDHKAIDQFVAILDIDDQALHALNGLERLYQKQQKFAELVDILERKLALEKDLDNRSVLFEQISTIYHDLLNDTASAIETWKKQLAEKSSDLKALEALEDLYRKDSAWDDLADHYEQWIQLLDDQAEQKTSIQYKLAQTSEIYLQNGEKAVEIYKNIIENYPQYAPVRAALATLFSDLSKADTLGVDRKEIADILEPLYRSEGLIAELVPILQLKQEEENNDAQRIKLLLEIADFQEQHLGNKPEAFKSRLLVLELDPGLATNRQHLNKLALSKLEADFNAFELLANGLEIAAQDASEESLQHVLLLELGKISEIYLDQNERAQNAYRQIIDQDSNHEDGIKAMVALLSKLGQWQALIDLYKELGENAKEVEDKKKYYFKACALLKDSLDDAQQAIETYKSILEIDATNAEAFKELDRLYREQESFHDLSDLYIDQIEVYEAQAMKANLRHELAKLYLNHLNMAEDALETWRALLNENDPTFKPAFDALEALLSGWKDQGTAEHKRQTIAEILTPLYIDQKQWNEWIAVQKILIEFESDPWSQADMLIEIAKIQENELKDGKTALLTYGAAFERKYPDQALQVELFRLAKEQNAWEDLIKFYMSGVEECGDTEEVIAILIKVAQIQENELKHINDAIDTYQLARTKDENHLDVLNQLERLFELTERYHDLVGVLGAQADLIDDSAKKKSYWYRVSALLERLGRNEDSIDTYLKILDEDDKDIKAIDALNRLYTALGRWQESVDLLINKQDLLKDKESAVQVENLHLIAKLQLELLAQPMAAIDTWQDIIKISALDELALSKLKDTQKQLSLWDDLLATLEAERKHYEESTIRAISLDFEIAALYETELKDINQAIELYAKVLERMPAHQEALIALENLLSHQEYQYESALVLEKHYQSKNEHLDLIRILGVQLKSIDDAEDRASLFKRQAKLLQEQLNEPAQAYGYYLNALLENIEDEEALKALQSIANQLSLFQDLANAYMQLAQKEPHSDIAVQLHRKRAKLCESKLGQSEEAIISWERVLEVDQTDAEALNALSDLYEQQGLNEKLCDILSIRVEETADDLALKVKYGHLLDLIKNQPVEAIEQWRDVLEKDAFNLEAREALEAKIPFGHYLEDLSDILQPIYEDQKLYPNLVMLLEAKLQFGLISDPYQQEEVYAQIAKLQHHELQSPAQAFESYAKAFALNPTNEEVRVAFLALGEALGQRLKLIEALELALGSMSDPDLCEADHLKLAAWYQEQGDLFNATRHYQELLKLNPAHHVALNALENIYLQQSQWEELALIYRSKIEALEDEKEQVRYWHILAELQNHQLYQSNAAIQSYDQILSIDESDLKAYQALAQIYLSLGQIKKLLDLYERQIESKTQMSQSQKVELLLKAGELAFADQDRYRSASFYQKALELDDQQQMAIEQLQVLYFQLADWDSLKEIKEKALKLVISQGNHSAQLELNLELALICQDRLMQPDDALEFFKKVLSLNPGHPSALQKTKALLHEQHRFADLIEVLENYLEIAQRELDSADLIALYLELASAYEQENDSSKAIQYLNTVLTFDENHSKALTLLASLYEMEGDLEKAANTLNRALSNASGSDSVEAWRKLGNLYLDSLNEAEKAKDAYKNAITQSGSTDVASMDALIRIARDQENAAEVVYWMETKAPLLSGKDKAKTLLELSQLVMKDDQDAAIRHLEEAYQLQASDLKIADKLLEIYLKTQRYDEAEPILSRIIQELQIAKQIKAVSKYAYRQGQILEGRGNLSAAKDAYEQCKQSDATFVPNLIAYSRLLGKLDQWEAAQEILKGLLLQRQVTNEEKVEIFYLNGMARLKHADPKKAKEMFQRALAVDENHEPSKSELAQLG